MRFNKMVLASFLALSLVACGGGNDTSEADRDKDKAPVKDANCVAAGDRCKLVNGQWVIEEPDANEPPAEGSELDNSDLGVTDKLTPEVKGFVFYHKGANSPLDRKRFNNRTVTLTPSSAFSSQEKYDVDLWNFVAIAPHKSDGKVKGEKRWMFDKIGIVNQSQNMNLNFFGTDGSASSPGDIGKSSLVGGNYIWARIPAVVNTFMWIDVDNVIKREYRYPDKKIWWNDEADTYDEPGTGKKSTRVYGVNAFLESNTANSGQLIKINGTPATSADTYKLAVRKVENYVKHANFVYYNPSIERRVNAGAFSGTFNPALAKYNGTDNKFPTDVELGALKHVQFGRVSGSGISEDAPSVPGYDDEMLKSYPFSTKGNALAGNDKAEDWYYARGTKDTPVSRLDELKSKGAKIAYDGQALMFGLDYDPVKTGVKEPKPKTEEGKSTNSVMPKEPEKYASRTAFLDGRQNFVRLVWNPSNGHLNGEVYGVWTAAKYWVSLEDVHANLPKNKIVPLKADDNTVVLDDAPATMADSIPVDFTQADKVLKNAELITMARVPLVDLKAKLANGTNMFVGSAVRLSDKNEGLLVGGFFGEDGSEIGGLINSQTGKYNNPDLQDPAKKWGGSFGAQAHFEKPQNLEYLDFPDDETHDYNAGFERF